METKFADIAHQVCTYGSRSLRILHTKFAHMVDQVCGYGRQPNLSSHDADGPWSGLTGRLRPARQHHDPQSLHKRRTRSRLTGFLSRGNPNTRSLHPGPPPGRYIDRHKHIYTKFAHMICLRIPGRALRTQSLNVSSFMTRSGAQDQVMTPSTDSIS